MSNYHERDEADLRELIERYRSGIASLIPNALEDPLIRTSQKRKHNCHIQQ